MTDRRDTPSSKRDTPSGGNLSDDRGDKRRRFQQYYQHGSSHSGGQSNYYASNPYHGGTYTNPPQGQPGLVGVAPQTLVFPWVNPYMQATADPNALAAAVQQQQQQQQQQISQTQSQQGQLSQLQQQQQQTPGTPSGSRVADFSSNRRYSSGPGASNRSPLRGSRDYRDRDRERERDRDRDRDYRDRDRDRDRERERDRDRDRTSSTGIAANSSTPPFPASGSSGSSSSSSSGTSASSSTYPPVSSNATPAAAASSVSTAPLGQSSSLGKPYRDRERDFRYYPQPASGVHGYSHQHPAHSYHPHPHSHPHVHAHPSTYASHQSRMLIDIPTSSASNAASSAPLSASSSVSTPVVEQSPAARSYEKLVSMVETIKQVLRRQATDAQTLRRDYDQRNEQLLKNKEQVLQDIEHVEIDITRCEMDVVRLKRQQASAAGSSMTTPITSASSQMSGEALPEARNGNVLSPAIPQAASSGNLVADIYAANAATAAEAHSMLPPATGVQYSSINESPFFSHGEQRHVELRHHAAKVVALRLAALSMRDRFLHDAYRRRERRWRKSVRSAEKEKSSSARRDADLVNMWMDQMGGLLRDDDFYGRKKRSIMQGANEAQTGDADASAGALGGINGFGSNADGDDGREGRHERWLRIKARCPPMEGVWQHARQHTLMDKEKKRYALGKADAPEFPFVVDTLGMPVFQFVSCNGRVDDPIPEYQAQRTRESAWTDSEKAIFLEKYMLFPKQFRRIATFLPNKTVFDCVCFYYNHKHALDLKQRVERMAIAQRASRRADSEQYLQNVHLQMSAVPGLLGLPDRASFATQAMDVISRVRFVPHHVTSVHLGFETDLAIQQCAVASNPTAEFNVWDDESDAMPNVLVAGANGLGLVGAMDMSIAKPDDDDHLGMNSGIAMAPLGVYGDDEEKLRWTDAEKQQFLSVFKDTGRDFVAIAARIRTKNAAQCKNFYHNYKRKHGLDETLTRKASTGGIMSTEDDMALMASFAPPPPPEPISNSASNAGAEARRRGGTTWTNEEKQTFQDMLARVGKDWAAIQRVIPTKEINQIQNFFQNNRARLRLDELLPASQQARKRRRDELD